uniref:Uncharacterized protein n=1 Tax=Ditylenchus dipsaci TaxID=166011 RepID=A0A915DKA1_9BILA
MVALKEILFEQLNFPSVRVGDEEFSTKWFLTGDMKFLCSLFGHLGPNATHACLLCEAPSTSFKENVAGEERTLDKIKESSKKYQEEFIKELKPAEKTALNRSCKSITKAPLVKINVNCVVPSPLHIILGLGQDLLNLVQKEAKTLGVEEQLEDVYKRLGADKRQSHEKIAHWRWSAKCC